MIKTIFKRVASYHWGSKMFIFGAPVFAWSDWTYVVTDIDLHTVLRYLADATLCAVITEIVTHYKEK